MTFEEARKIVARLETDADVQTFLDALIASSKVIVANAYTRSHVKAIVEEDISEDEWLDFDRYVSKTEWADECNEALAEIWHNFRADDSYDHDEE
jgi:hypothetical protein